MARLFVTHWKFPSVLSDILTFLTSKWLWTEYICNQTTCSHVSEPLTSLLAGEETFHLVSWIRSFNQSPALYKAPIIVSDPESPWPGNGLHHQLISQFHPKCTQISNGGWRLKRKSLGEIPKKNLPLAKWKERERERGVKSFSDS